MTHTVPRLQAGFSIIELMIAMALSLTLGVAIISVFVNNTHSFNQDENVARMQDDARHALRELATDISMAGHYAELHVPNAVVPDGALTIGTDCGPAGEANWMYQTIEAGTSNSLSIMAIDNASNAAAAAQHSCFASGEVLDGTDIVSIKRVSGGQTGLPQIGSVYLRTNGTVGLLYQAPMPAAPAITVDAPASDWEFRPSIYFIRPYANAPGDGTPALCRKVLQMPGPSMSTECLATGIENLQVEYGIDTSQNGQPNVFTSSPTLADIQNVVSARIFLLARTTDIDVKYANTKVFSISNAADYAPDDSFHRRVFSTSVAIHNIRSLSMMGF
jgi:type II secretory pathway pseudopilin PulG